MTRAPTTDEQVIEQRLDLEMLERPHLWPAEHRGMRCVFLRRHVNIGEAQTGPCFKVDDGYVVMQHDWTNGGAVTALNYQTAEAVYSDGWRVD